MLQQDRDVNPGFRGQAPVNSQKRCEKDGNFNFLGQDEDPSTGDENRNQVRPRALGRDGSGPLSPLSRLPCWSPLEPLPEIESGDDTGGRVPPDGAEEHKMDAEMRRETDEEKESGKVEDEEEEEEEEEEWWADSDEEFEFSYRSESSSRLSVESADIAGPNSLWDQISRERPAPENGNATTVDAGKKQSKTERRESIDLVENGSLDSDSDPCSEVPDLMEAVWTLQERERFKAQEMEKHQVQLIMYRRLALIRWLRTLQSRVQEQQNRLQSSFDVILTHRKELLRMSATAAQ
ncbi:hypothetical protein R3I93_015854 [Phoxinus phoxinus]|uniref:Uncharacterized protein n=1 Tax=Phoxinus phoxinus TaxID=58324 RepID=A0AAN9CM66_9TELE